MRQFSRIGSKVVSKPKYLSKLKSLTYPSIPKSTEYATVLSVIECIYYCIYRIEYRRLSTMLSTMLGYYIDKCYEWV